MRELLRAFRPAIYAMPCGACGVFVVTAASGVPMRWTLFIAPTLLTIFALVTALYFRLTR